jgi:hypothetical protein
LNISTPHASIEISNIFENDALEQLDIPAALHSDSSIIAFGRAESSDSTFKASAMRLLFF